MRGKKCKFALMANKKATSPFLGSVRYCTRVQALYGGRRLRGNQRLCLVRHCAFGCSCVGRGDSDRPSLWD